MRLKGVLFMSALTGTIGLVAVPAAQANAAPAFSMKGFYRIVADADSGRLFLSQGAGAGSIVVANLAGQEVGTISGTAGAAGITVSPDGKTLYAALPAQDAVLAVSTTTLKQTAVYSLGPGNAPSDVAWQSGKVWVSYGQTGQAAIGDIDPAAPPASAFTPQPVMGTTWYYPADLAADPLDEGVLVAAEPQLSAASVSSFDVSSGTPTVLAVGGASGCEYLADVAVAPGGKEFVVACESPYDQPRFSTKTLTQLGDYPSNTNPNAVAIASTGTVAAGVQGWYTPGLYIYHQDSTTLLNQYDFGGPTWVPVTRGLAWSANGFTLYVVIAHMGTSAYKIVVLNRPDLIITTLRLGGAFTAVLGKSVTLTGSLTFAKGAPRAGTEITITRTRAGSTATRRFAVALAADGTFRLTDRPLVLGTYTYTAAYAGDTVHQPATATRTVTITRFPVTLTLRANSSSVNYKSLVTVTAHLGKTYTGRTVSIYAQPFGSKVKKLLRSGRVNASGDLTASYVPAYSIAFSAVFGGDARYAPRTAMHNVYVRARVATEISGYFTSVYINGVLYRVYHHTATQRLDVTVFPNKAGECVQAEGQLFAQGAWQPALSTGCAYLSKASTAYGLFGLSQVNGYRLRIRADYIRSASDNTNLSNDSGWLYFEVVN